MKAFLVIEFTSVSAGYLFLQSLTSLSVVEVHEAALKGNGTFFIFASMTQNETSQVEKMIKGTKTVRDHIFFADEKLVVSEGLYGLLPQKIEKFLGVVESPTLSGNLRTWLALCAQFQCQMIELQAGRSGGKSLLYFTGEKSQGIEEYLQQQKSAHQLEDFAVITTPNSSFRQYFNLTNVDKSVD